jgi:uncharacterized protein
MKLALRLLRVSLLATVACSLNATPLRALEGTEGDDPASSAIRVYQHYLSSMRHLHCRFAPSCSQYAIEAIARYGVVEGSARAADRLMRCNASSESRYPRNANGLLVDPVDGGAGSATSVRAPDWLLLAPDGTDPPVAASLATDRRARLDETVAFARMLEERGDCERASAEYQRAGALADTVAAHAWAYVHVADCYFRSAQWFFADRAYLTAAMLTTDPRRRAAVGYAAAASRFNAGAFVACARLLSDSALVVSEPAGIGGAAAPEAPLASVGGTATLPPGRVAALAGMCGLAMGEWGEAEEMLQRAARECDDSGTQARILRLAACADRGRELPHRSAGLAGALSALVPGAGQTYSGHSKDGVRHLIFNSALIYTVASLASHGEVPASVIVGGVALPFYVGNVLGAQEAARRFNREQRMRLLERSIDENSR